MGEKYVVDKNKNLVEGLSKEETYDLLAEAIKNGTLPDINTDNAFITQIKDSVTGYSHKVAFVTQAKYNELKNANALISNCLYYIVDDSTEEDITNAINQAKEEAIASANATTAEGLAKKLDKGEWMEYPFTLSADTDISVSFTRPEAGTYMCEIENRTSSGHRYNVTLPSFTIYRDTGRETRYSWTGTNIRYGNTDGTISVTFKWTLPTAVATIRSSLDNLNYEGEEGAYYLRIRKIAND